MMLNKRKKLITDSILLSISYLLLIFLWSSALQAILIPYDGLNMEMRPNSGTLRTINDFFEQRSYLLAIPIFLLVIGNIGLVLHRIHKRKMKVDYVLQHTYVTNFLFFFFKLFILTILAMFDIPHSLESVSPYRALDEIYLLVFIHVAFIFLLFVVHHKNITFHKKKLPI